MRDLAVCTVYSGRNAKPIDLEIPLGISADELICALYAVFEKSGERYGRFARCEYPPALLHGSRSLSEYGVRNGTVIRL